MSVALPMVQCVKCKKWSAGPHFAGWCRLCLVFMGLDPDSNPCHQEKKDGTSMGVP
ncbi:alphaK I8 [Puccinia sorghi]|uniref:AlphaK I8 n=1 Tax=Puccinia sorghi TaxID=27349 RepID=A0A0L6UJ50_9BASI|nr:alphaK I8 [Puccinia sorghi]